jgi:hydroxypyruvate reductase
VKQTVERIFRETLAKISVPVALETRLSRSASHIRTGKTIIDLRNYSEIIAISFGKASYAMAKGLISALAPDYAVRGILVTPPAEPLRELAGFERFTGGHPIPNEASFEAGRAILDRLAACGNRTIVFFLISGGGSSLVEWPLDPKVTIAEFQKLHHALVTCGAPIEEINAVRKHVSATKGGRLAAAAPSSTKITFAISDVPAGHESALASGPTIPDPTTIADAERVINKYKIMESVPYSLRAALERERMRETPKAGDPAFAKSHFEILLGEHELFHTAHHACEEAGFVSICENETDNWPIEKAADHLLKELSLQKERNPGRPVAIISSGEVSSPVTGDGIGGRNSAFVLACVPKIAGTAITVLSAGTDGIDGNSNAAGAIADGNTFSRGRGEGLDAQDFLRRSDAFNYFAALGDALITGPTGNNLRDLRILLME